MPKAQGAAFAPSIISNSHVPILSRVREYYCPSCHMTEHAEVPLRGMRMHTCPKMGYLTTPLLPVGVKAKHERHEREDYIGHEKVRLDADGRPVMSITTTRDDGQDCTVFAPTATARG